MFNFKTNTILNKLNVTPGEWTIEKTFDAAYEQDVIVINTSSGSDEIVSVWTWGRDEGEAEANAALIADAGTTYNKCHKLPSELMQENEEFKEVLRKISEWELPETGEFWDKEMKRPVSYEVVRGSNGVRDYFTSIAKELLTKHSQQS